MSPRSTVFAALALTALLACEAVLEPEVSVDVSSAALAKGPVVQSVTGSGSFLLNGNNRTFSFTARILADGSVDGQWVRVNHTEESRFTSHGVVTCLNIIENEAWIGGLATGGFVSDPPNNEVSWRVVDNGQGRNAPPDQISLQLLWFNTQPPGIAAWYCGATPSFPTYNDVVNGNIQVRD